MDQKAAFGETSLAAGVEKEASSQKTQEAGNITRPIWEMSKLRNHEFGWLLVCNLIFRRFLRIVWNWLPYVEGWERSKKEASHSRLVGSRFNKQGNLHERLALGGCKMSRSLHLPTRILWVYIEALTGFSNIYHPDDLNTTSYLKATSFAASGSREGKQNAQSKDRKRGEEPPIAGAQLTSLALLITSSNSNWTKTPW